mmetsp:Transcript_16152/g.50537  ORF Transcript_16152/g.50537 Transcript_16152/m.50537 type:complete len:116 (-) Transcript_16152:620-967(-)
MLSILLSFISLIVCSTITVTITPDSLPPSLTSSCSAKDTIAFINIGIRDVYLQSELFDSLVHIPGRASAISDADRQFRFHFNSTVKPDSYIYSLYARPNAPVVQQARITCEEEGQ